MELPHVVEVGHAKTPTEIGGQPLGKVLNQLLPISSTFLPALFLLDDEATDVPVGRDHGGIDGAPDAGAGGLEQGGYLRVEVLATIVGTVVKVGRVGRHLLVGGYCFEKDAP